MVSEKIRAYIYISGRVQGVFFRENTRRLAETLGIKGWIKNLVDGRVEAVFEGEKENVQKIIDLTKKGPDSAKVDNFEIKWENYKGEFENFEIKF